MLLEAFNESTCVVHGSLCVLEYVVEERRDSVQRNPPHAGQHNVDDVDPCLFDLIV